MVEWFTSLWNANRRIEFREEDNPMTSLLDGKVKFKIYFSPALPMEYAEFDCEIDTEYYNNLFSA